MLGIDGPNQITSETQKNEMQTVMDAIDAQAARVGGRVTRTFGQRSKRIDIT